ncbi:MAG: ABC transporter permease [Acidobacteria bacterium]|nr:ABC transporter permease [Acidobacteriota bacterium]
MNTLWQDLRYGARMLFKNPGFTLVAVIALALGIGANTAIFSVVNSVLLRPLNYRDSDRLVQLNHNYPKLDLKASVSASGYTHYRDNNKSFENLGACTFWPVNLTGSGDPERLTGMTVSHTFFPTLGVEAAKGRIFTPDEDQPGRNHVVVLSDNLWQRRFAADQNIIGKTLTLSGENYTVVGVMPPDFQFGSEMGQVIDIYSPIAFTPQQLDVRRWRNEFLIVIGRLKPNVTLGQAQVEMDTIAANVRQQYFGGGDANDPSSWGLLLRSLREIVVGDIRPALLVLMSAVGFVLLIACANVANLLLARAAVRQKEIAIRTALGAGRWRVVRQLLTESVLLALIGGLLGVLLAYWGIGLLLSLNENLIPRANEVGIDGRVLAFTFAVALLTGLLFGLVPALQVSKTDLHETLKEGGRSGVAHTRRWLRSSLVVFEVMSAIVLLIGAGLLIKSFRRVQEVNPGFNPNNLLVMQVSLPNTRYREPVQVDGFFQKILTEAAALPGVKSAGLSSTVPMSGGGSSGSFNIEGRTVPPGQMAPWGNRWAAGASYFQTMNIPLIRGRYFDDRDVIGAPGVAIIDETMARKFWPNEDPIGRRITFERDPQGNTLWREIVGIVGHVKQRGLDGESPVQYYYPHRQRPSSSVFLVARTVSEPQNMTGAVRGVIQSADKELPVFRVTTMERMVADSNSQRRFSTILLSVFALVALILASVGLFGVMSYTVAQRTHEIGIRMALGASKANVLKLVVNQGLILTMIGVVFGLAAAFGLTRLMSTLLFGVRATDPLTFALLPFVLALVALLACYIPARRATKVDPMVALRYE